MVLFITIGFAAEAITIYLNGNVLIASNQDLFDGTNNAGQKYTDLLDAYTDGSEYFDNMSIHLTEKGYNVINPGIYYWINRLY